MAMESAVVAAESERKRLANESKGVVRGCSRVRTVVRLFASMDVKQQRRDY
jgi:hypothetical protein